MVIASNKMANNFMLDMPVLQGAKVCGAECVYKQNDGSIEALKSGIVSCVGCGKPCHLQCLKVTGDLLETVKATPKNNRGNAYFGEASNVRIVCDNCLTWLSCEVPTDSKASFLLVFSRIAAKLISEKYVEKTRDTPGSRKRKLTENGDLVNVDSMAELKDMMGKFLHRLDDIDKKSDSSDKSIKAHIIRLGTRIDDTVKSELESVKTSITSKYNDIGDKLKSHGDKIDNLSVKIDEKVGLDITVVENGHMRGGLNAPALVSTPSRPINRSSLGSGSTIRRRAMMNNARSLLLSDANETPRTALSRNSGPSIPTQRGTAVNDDIFGPAIQRLTDHREAASNGSIATRSQFRQKSAVYVRYVSSSITTDKMRDILKRDARIARYMSENDASIEITRLVKKNVPEDNVVNRKNGVSYRIGCPDDVYPIMIDPSFWASHWEIRPWNDELPADRRNHGGHQTKNDTSSDHHHPPSAQPSTSTVMDVTPALPE